jgi:hypothetical protein
MLDHLQDGEGIARFARKADKQPGPPGAWVAREIIVNPDRLAFYPDMDPCTGILFSLEYFHTYMV